MAKRATAFILSLLLMLGCAVTVVAEPLQSDAPILSPAQTLTPDPIPTEEATPIVIPTPTEQPAPTIEPAATEAEPAATPDDSTLIPGSIDCKQRDLLNKAKANRSSFMNKGQLNKIDRKFDNTLLQLTNDAYLLSGTTKNQLIEQMKKQNQIETKTKSGKTVFSVTVYVQLKDGFASDSIKPYINEIKSEDCKAGLYVASVNQERLQELAALDAVRRISTVYKPIVHSTGFALSEGDSVLKAAAMRTQFGANGTGVKIGVISDGVDSISNAITSGDLPPTVHVLSNTQGGDEGTAMLEIIHDLAPGASLYFHDCGAYMTDFNQAITALVIAGCNIIVDDISWFEEAYFEDGLIARHVDDVLKNNNVVYVSAAGNASGATTSYAHYQGMFSRMSDDWHDFSGGKTSTTDLYFNIPAGSTIVAVLQWKEPFLNASNDYDLYLFDAYGKVDESTGTQSPGNGSNPFELIQFTNGTGSNRDYLLAVDGQYASTAKELEVYVYCFNGASRYSNNITYADSIYGHPAVRNVIACGAVNADTPLQIEPFSSRGPVTLLNETRNKPDIVGADGVDVTGVGGFSDPFYGTSAAAPHIAAIAALLMQRYPTESADSIRAILLNNADDLGTSGFDTIYGYGKANALKAALSKSYVRFDPQDGTGASHILANNNTKIAAPAVPTRAGYTFSGWYQDAACVTPWNFASDIVVSDITLYAKWGFMITVQSANAKFGTVSASSIFQTGNAVTVVAQPKAGYCFTGWTEGTTLVSVNAVYTFTAEAVRTLRANFIKIGTPALSSATTVGYSGVRLNWTAVANATGYEVYRSKSRSRGYALLATTVGLEYNDATSTSGVTYYYKIRALWRQEGISASYSAYSNNRSVKPKWPTITLTATATNYHTVALTWNDLPFADRYELSRSTSSRSGFSVVPGAEALTEPGYVDDKLTQGQTYYYRIRGYEAAGNQPGPYSRIKSVKPNWAAAKLTSAILQGYHSATLNWNAVPSADGYAVFRSTSSHRGFVQIATDIAATNYTDHSLSAGSVYYYKIVPYDVVDGIKIYGNYSNVRSVRPKWPPVTLFVNALGNSLQLTWTGIGNVDGYEVQRYNPAIRQYEPIGDASGNIFTDSALTAGYAYRYRVRAFVVVGTTRIYGAFSKHKTAKAAAVALL